MPRPTAGSQEKKRITFSLDLSTYAQLAETAWQQKRPVSQLVALWIEERIASSAGAQGALPLTRSVS